LPNQNDPQFFEENCLTKFSFLKCGLHHIIAVGYFNNHQLVLKKVSMHVANLGMEKILNQKILDELFFQMIQLSLLGHVEEVTLCC
jgi:hypothetical protein